MSNINELLKTSTDTPSINEGKSGLTDTLKVIGTSNILLGVIAGFSLISGDDSFLGIPSWTLGLSVMISSIVGGTLFLGFAEIIRLLSCINNKLGRGD